MLPLLNLPTDVDIVTALNLCSNSGLSPIYVEQVYSEGMVLLRSHKTIEESLLQGDDVFVVDANKRTFY